MRFFLDSANLDEVREAASWGILAGVTTNPSLVAREGVDFHTRIRQIAEFVSGPISAEVLAQDREGMLREARVLSRIAGNVVIKVPVCPEGLAAANRLAEEGIATNVTLVFSEAQALLAAAAGASYVSPFVGRLDDVGESGIELVENIASLYAIHGIQVKIIAASIRNSLHVRASAHAGAHYATVPFKIMQGLFLHELTTKGIEKFTSDWEACQKQ